MNEPLSNAQILEHVSYHVFLPPKLPQRAQSTVNSRLIDYRLAELALDAVDSYDETALNGSQQWTRMAQMLSKLAHNISAPLEKNNLVDDMVSMESGDVLALYIQAQNAAVIIRTSHDTTTFEIFEAQAPNDSVMSTSGKLVRHFPGPAVQVPNSIARDPHFIDEIANFLAHMNVDVFEDATQKTVKANHRNPEGHDIPHPKYISQLFVGILRGFGQEIQPRRILKRIADEVLWDGVDLPWRRSPIWLIIRIALHTSIDPTDYKHFMLYVHIQLLNHSCEESLPSDLLAAMRVKTARRLLKVQKTVPEFLIDAAKAASDQVEKLLQDRWSAIQNVPEFKPLVLNLDEAIVQSLPESREYLNQVLQGRPNLNKSSTFSPNHTDRLVGSSDCSVFTNGALAQAFAKSKYLALFDFEDAVHKHLPTWVDDNIKQNSTTACAVVFSCLEQYTSAALSYYKEDVADQSIMILTIMELWVALDRLATSQHDILLYYSPEIPDNLLETLLLRSELHLERATMVQTYLRSRHARATRGTVFTSAFTQDSLPVRFFDQSAELRDLKQDIEREAQRQRDEKIKEMHQLNAEHDRLTREISAATCGTWTDWRTGYTLHDPTCHKCQKERGKNSMKIDVHEWPLPSNQADAEAVVFELRCPEEINLWRTVTFSILCDLGGSPSHGYFLHERKLAGYDGLSQWSSKLKSSNHRITIASSTGSFRHSQYSSTKIPTTESVACVNNGLRFELIESSKNTRAHAPFDKTSFAKYGTLTLPVNTPYCYLQFSLAGTTHTSNQILADQFDCPKDLSLHEHYAFGTLRSGPRLQWMNIIRGLEENTFTFSREEVDLLHTQAAWQIGVLSKDNVSRDWHLELSELEFGSRLVQQTTRVLERVQANWLEAMTVRTIIMLIARLLSSITEPRVHREAYKFLRKARDVAFGWLRQISLKLQEAVIESQLLDYQQRLCEMAAICRSTYDVDSPHLSELLSDAGDYLALVSCSVALYDNQPPDFEKAPQHLQTLLCRDRRLSFKVLPVLLERIRRDPRLFDDSVFRSWNGYCPGVDGWTELPTPNSRWVTTTTANGLTINSQQVHLNLMEGRLLVDTSSSDMIFTTSTHIEGNQVLFCMDENTKELIVQTLRDATTYELIPHSKLANDFPMFFSSEYHHWINLDTKVLEFRPLTNPWVPSEENWRLRLLSSSKSVMEKITETGITSLIDIHSRAFQDIAHHISPLESPRYLHVTRSTSRGVEITALLPRMKLTFFVNRGAQLESRNFRGQVIDRNQSTGTMYGLRDQLVLRAKDSKTQSLPPSRSVLIPYGSIRFHLQTNHPSVTIDRGSGPHVTFYQYKVDGDLGYLVNNNANLTSRLFKIYLHALTSHCLSDPLTGRTGTEEALYELDESATTSFEQIDQEQAQLLNLIGKLTPEREYYPISVKATQRTTWASLPPLSQHYAFCTAANSILERARALHMFSPLSFDIDGYIVKTTKFMLQRATCRTRMYYPVDALGRLPILLKNSDNNDQWYEAKDHPLEDWSEQCQLACWASDLAHKTWGQPTYLTQDLVSQFEQWISVRGPTADLKMTYSRHWLNLHLPSSWLSMYDLCRRGQTTENRYRLGVCLAAGAYSGLISPNLIPVLISFTANPFFQSLDPPTHMLYELSDKYAPTEERLSSIISDSCRHILGTPSANISREANESEPDWVRRKANDYHSNISTHRSQLTRFWLDSWPLTPPVPSGPYSSWFEVGNCLQQVRAYFDTCSRNKDIRDHLRAVETVLSSGPISHDLGYSNITSALPKPASQKSTDTYDMGSFSLSSLMKHRIQPELIDVPISPAIYAASTKGISPDTAGLKALLTELHGNTSRPVHARYGFDLEAGRVDLSGQSFQVFPDKLPSLWSLEQNRALFQCYLRKNFKMIEEWIGPVTKIEAIVFAAGVWSRLTPRTILSTLALRTRAGISMNHQVELRKYARAYLEYQRSQRLIRFALDEKHDDFFKELNLADAELGSEANHPDWLLTQIDGNFSARSLQTKVAREMITPSPGANTVLQLNMGEGKSSVIIPLIAAALADNTRFVRVVVLQPLWRQMFHLLVSRLSGLVNRRICYLPFGRHIRVDEQQARQIQDMYQECMREGGILLVQPEHILSFKLMGIYRLLSSSAPEHVAASKRLLETQKWLSENARDILDESDEILHVRYQLVYAVGNQQPLEGHPDRWTTTQQVLSLVAKHANPLKKAYPDKLKYEVRGSGQFPFVQIMPGSENLVHKLIHSIAKDAINGIVPNLNLSLLPRATRDLTLRFLTERDVSQREAHAIQSLDPSMRGGLLLLRGLLACGIIAFALRDKRYRVDYGLHLSRSLLAVPYNAKDVPSLRGEFGHPDVAAVLTCLSYYYEGLTESQLDKCFELLYKLDNPDLEYEQWARRNKDTPSSIRQLGRINLKDREQFTQELVPAFAFNSAVVDFFLSSVVFRAEAKRFPCKLSTSGWDLAEVKRHVTTGFSGTSDNRYLLPTSITQSDPLKLSATNALVLTYLLQPENNHYLPMQRPNGDTCSSKEFLDILVKQEPEIRVLLDVGAQMLELKNEELLKYWLELRPDIAAAVYFNDKDELMILPQNGSPTSFYSSPFAERMDKCIIYLDDSHTRGTDLKLPKGTRAATTLGPKVTKDRLLQGCMRMRMLGFGQSVIFCAPPEIDAQIRKAANLTRKNRIETLDVIRWAMLETCKDLEHHISHWVQQGVEYHRRADALQNFAQTGNIKDLLHGWIAPESQTLEEMYGVSSSATGIFGALYHETFGRLIQLAREIANGQTLSYTTRPGNIPSTFHRSRDVICTALGVPSLKEQLGLLGFQKLEDSGMDEEQEREVSHEVEQERHITRPPKSIPACHTIHPDVIQFVQTGSLLSSSMTGIVSLFIFLAACKTSQLDKWSSKLFASLDFCNTLKETAEVRPSEYMRPLNWVLSGLDGTLLALSPYEANNLLPDIRGSAFVRLHVFAPRVRESMLSFSDLQFYPIPSPANSLLPSNPPDLLPQLQLSLFAGQLYFKNYAQYRAMCGFLGIFIGTKANQDLSDIQIQSDGFILESDRQKLMTYVPEYAECKFTTSPLSTVKNLVGYRRKGMEYLRTHLGQMLHAHQLQQESRPNGRYGLAPFTAPVTSRRFPPLPRQGRCNIVGKEGVSSIAYRPEPW